MGLLVAEKAGLLPKALAAFEADKRLFTRVSSYVDSQVRVDAEGFVANGALVRAFPGMGPEVDLQMVGFGKPLAAHLAAIRPFSCVGTVVDLQVGTLVEALLAYEALVRAFPCVNSLVDLQLVGAIETFAAVPAQVWCRAASDNGGRRIGGDNVLISSNFLCVAVPSGMDSLMQEEGLALAEALLAL